MISTVRSAQPLMDTCVPLTEVGREDVGEVGGKGAGLGEMLRAGIPVPAGFVVTTAAYPESTEGHRWTA